LTMCLVLFLVAVLSYLFSRWLLLVSVNQMHRSKKNVVVSLLLLAIQN